MKNLTTGEGGAITTNCKDYYEKILKLRSHGTILNPEIGPWHYDIHQLGFNYRLTDISGALGLSQLKKLDTFIQKRKDLAKRYENIFKDIDGIKPLYKYTNNSAYHLYIVKINFSIFNCNKKNFFLRLREKNIFLQYHYIPINKQPYYKELGYGSEKTPIMNEYYEKAVSIPLFPKLSYEEQDYVIKSILEVLND